MREGMIHEIPFPVRPQRFRKLDYGRRSIVLLRHRAALSSRSIPKGFQYPLKLLT